MTLSAAITAYKYIRGELSPIKLSVTIVCDLRPLYLLIPQSDRLPRRVCHTHGTGQGAAAGNELKAVVFHY